jgi:hypothetical protein
MPTECSAKQLEFAPIEGRQVVAAFDGGTITSDAGALLLGQTDKVIRLINRFAACFADTRRPELIEHEVRRPPRPWPPGGLVHPIVTAHSNRKERTAATAYAPSTAVDT